MDVDSKKLAKKAISGVLSSPVIMGAPIFLAAGTFNYWQAWLFLAVFTIAVALHTSELLFHDPETLVRRMNVGPKAEKRPLQKLIIVALMFGGLLVAIVCGLDHRFGWSAVPPWVVVLGDCGVVLSYVIFSRVLKENRYAAATIQVEQKQTVISTGLYGIVRHPMYAGGLFLLLSSALALGSYWGIPATLLFLIALHFRIVDEEQALSTELHGYDEYRQKVRYRLIPGLY